MDDAADSPTPPSRDGCRWQRHGGDSDGRTRHDPAAVGTRSPSRLPDRDCGLCRADMGYDPSHRSQGVCAVTDVDTSDWMLGTVTAARCSVELQDVTIERAGVCAGSERLRIVEGFSLHAATLGITCLSGRSGSGKTTLLNTAAGLLPPT